MTRLLPAIALVIFPLAGICHETRFLHVDEYLTHDEARALGFEVSQSYNPKTGMYLIEVLYPPVVTGLQIDSGLTNESCDEAGPSSEKPPEPSDPSARWRTTIETTLECAKTSQSIGLYGGGGSWLFFGIGFEI